MRFLVQYQGMSGKNDSPKPICVVLDTNIWVYKTSLLRTPLGAAVTNALLRAQGVLGLPEVVEEEIVKHTARAGWKAATQIRENAAKIARLIGWENENWYLVPTHDQFESSARERLEELGFLMERVPFNFEQAKSALQRVVDETPPNGPKNQQYKDSVIWEAVLGLSDNYLVHFITEDKGFFEDRNPSKGLASSLEEDRQVGGRRIFVHYELESYLESLRDTVPPLDHRHLASTIHCAIVEDLNQLAAEQGFQLDELIDWNISAFLTENTDTLALSFELVQQVSVVSPPEGEVAARLVTHGECSYSLREKSASDVRIEYVRLWDLKGNRVHGKGMVYLRTGEVVPSRRPYSLRFPLDEE
jgi:hypothetical protein